MQLIFEHAGLYNDKGELADDAGAVGIDRAMVRRPGEHELHAADLPADLLCRSDERREDLP